jgi:SAM-dependent methyltransferase
VSFHTRLRGSVDGITPTEMRALMSVRDRFRRGYLTHVFLHASLEHRDGTGQDEIRSQVRRPGLGKQIILANVHKMRKLVARLESNPPSGVWLGYAAHNTYTDDDAAHKDGFVRTVTASASWPLVWDLGCNTGRHARIAAETAQQVVAIDADQGPVEVLYRTLREAGDERILPLTINLADPSPGLGWRGVERKSLLDRGRPDLVLALAVVHHLVIGANVPLREVVRWLADLGGALVVEFPTREDPMVQKLLKPKRAGLHDDYAQEVFERCLSEAFDVRRKQRLSSGTRILYFATPRAGAGGRDDD